MLAKGQKEIVSESTCDGIENQKMIKALFHFQAFASTVHKVKQAYWLHSSFLENIQTRGKRQVQWKIWDFRRKINVESFRQLHGIFLQLPPIPVEPVYFLSILDLPFVHLNLCWSFPASSDICPWAFLSSSIANWT